MPRRYKQGADGQPHPAFYGKLPEEFSKADTMRFMVETDLKLSGCVSADTLAALRAEGYDYKDGNLVPAGKEKSMQEKTAGGTPAAPIKLDVSVRVIEPVKNLMGFASVKFNDCFVVENLKIVQGSKGLFLGMPSQPDGKGGYRDMAYPVPSALTQNVKDFLASPEIENIFENSDFLVLLSQAQGDRQILAKQLGISPHQLSYVTHTNSGEGLLFFGNTTIPFVDRFPQNTELYAIMTTRPEDKKQEMNRA